MRHWGYNGLLEVMPQMGVDPNFFSPLERKVTAPVEGSKGSDRPFNIGYLGRLAHSKGIDLIFAAMRELRQQGLNVCVTICGSGEAEEALKQEAENQLVADLVIWRGAVRHEQAPKELGTFDVLVLPSRTTPAWKEQFGHVLIEAMAMGIPVVGSSSGEIPNVIGRSDLVFQEEDAQGLTVILERLIHDPQWWHHVSQYGIDRVRQHYSHERIAERLIELWQSIQTDSTLENY
jgi:glycosyltransferase involved in cell wall biosynthesis